MQAVLPGLRHQWRTTPGDLRTAVGRADRGLLVLIPDQRPTQRRAPEVPDRLRTVARNLGQESAAGQELVARLYDAELIAFGVCQHDVTLLRALADIDVAAAELQRPRHRLLLVLEGCARQMEVNLVLASLLRLRSRESGPEAGVIGRQDRAAAFVILSDIPAQEATPEPGQRQRVERID